MIGGTFVGPGLRKWYCKGAGGGYGRGLDVLPEGEALDEIPSVLVVLGEHLRHPLLALLQTSLQQRRKAGLL